MIHQTKSAFLTCENQKFFIEFANIIFFYNFEIYEQPLSRKTFQWLPYSWIRKKIWCTSTQAVISKITGVRLLENILAGIRTVISPVTRSSNRRCSIKEVLLKSFTNFAGKHLWWILFLIKLQALHLIWITTASNNLYQK